jgi:hypothetical protein
VPSDAKPGVASHDGLIPWPWTGSATSAMQILKHPKTHAAKLEI